MSFQETKLAIESQESTGPVVGSPTRRTFMNMLVASATLAPAVAQPLGDEELLAKFAKYRQRQSVLDEHHDENVRLYNSWRDFGETLMFHPDRKEAWEIIKQHPDAIAHAALNDRLSADYDASDTLCEEICNTRALTTEGKRAKLIVLFKHLLPDDWCVEGEDCDYEKRQARALMCELAEIEVDDLLAEV